MALSVFYIYTVRQLAPPAFEVVAVVLISQASPIASSMTQLVGASNNMQDVVANDIFIYSKQNLLG